MKFFQAIDLKQWPGRVIGGIVVLTVLAGALSPWVAETKTQEVIGQVFSAKEAPSFPVAEEREPAYTQWVVATAYSSDPWQTDSTPCIPAMNFDLCAHYEENGLENTIAANFLPLGTHVKLPELYGDKVFVVRDRMNARYNGTNRIDIWVGSETPVNQEIIANAKAKAIAFGVKQIKMEVF